MTDAEQAVHAAIDAWVADQSEGDCLVTGFILFVGAAMISDADSTSYLWMNADQPAHVSVGLVEMARRRFLRDSDPVEDD